MLGGATRCCCARVRRTSGQRGAGHGGAATAPSDASSSRADDGQHALIGGFGWRVAAPRRSWDTASGTRRQQHQVGCGSNARRAGRHAGDQETPAAADTGQQYQRPTPAVTRAIPSRCATGDAAIRDSCRSPRAAASHRARAVHRQTPARHSLWRRGGNYALFSQTVIKKSHPSAWSAPATRAGRLSRSM